MKAEITIISITILLALFVLFTSFESTDGHEQAHVQINKYFGAESTVTLNYFGTSYTHIDGNFYDNGISQDPFKNPGGTANYYHKKFQNKTGINSLSDIQVANIEGAELIPVAKGFYARNALVAKSDFILAMTFGKEDEVKEGGTADTVRKYLDRVRKEGMFDKSFHYDLNSGSIFIGCTVPLLENTTK